ncbi:hypothetical protein COLO4_22157 [Corchorus olitorius]|uniref:Uncharacterized protein n=1 Tax=Corchorus olitorius TaxID=93759 RepID=A0A1R3INQ5_9ROSI|nr:hypothetical protein COLO4_22157 [Corchorus olitorius]
MANLKGRRLDNTQTVVEKGGAIIPLWRNEKSLKRQKFLRSYTFTRKEEPKPVLKRAKKWLIQKQKVLFINIDKHTKATGNYTKSKCKKVSSYVEACSSTLIDKLLLLFRGANANQDRERLICSH